MKKKQTDGKGALPSGMPKKSKPLKTEALYAYYYMMELHSDLKIFHLLYGENKSTIK